MRAFDARCHACDGVQVVWVSWHHDSGDEIGIAHTNCESACGEYSRHTLVSALNGLSSHEKWEPGKK